MPDHTRQSLRATALIASALFLAACSHDGSTSPRVAGAGGTTSPSSAAPTKASALAYSQCMRSHGIKDFPDPDSNGELKVNAGPGSDLNGDDPKYQAADTACKPLLPNQGKPPANLKAANLKYARCMRKHGIADFPDPKPDGTLQIQAQPGGDLDPNNPRFTKADDACKRYQPRGGGDSGLSSGKDGS
ncbi:MAG TPA: hypothetical protein VHC49_09140 [Mycobacteriales bacterium]|nr:hypothetical protein [Mycobacteriales bacterium]